MRNIKQPTSITNVLGFNIYFLIKNKMEYTVLGNEAYSEQVDLPEAKASQIMGILSVVSTCCGFAIVAFILGILGMNKGRKAVRMYEMNPGYYTRRSYNQAKTGKLMGTIGLVLGIVPLIGLIIYLVFVIFLGVANGLQ